MITISEKVNIIRGLADFFEAVFPLIFDWFLKYLTTGVVRGGGGWGICSLQQIYIPYVISNTRWEADLLNYTHSRINLLRLSHVLSTL